MLAEGLSFYKNIKVVGYYYYVDNFRVLCYFINSFPSTLLPKYAEKLLQNLSQETRNLKFYIIYTKLSFLFGLSVKLQIPV